MATRHEPFKAKFKQLRLENDHKSERNEVEVRFMGRNEMNILFDCQSLIGSAQLNN